MSLLLHDVKLLLMDTFEIWSWLYPFAIASADNVNAYKLSVIDAFVMFHQTIFYIHLPTSDR